MAWTLYKYNPDLQKSFAIKSSDDLTELQSLGMTEARQVGHAGVWQSVEGQEDYNLFSMNSDTFGLLLYSVRPGGYSEEKTASAG